MKIKFLSTILLMAFSGGLYSQDLSVKVQDDLGNPVARAEVMATYDNPSKVKRYDQQIKFSSEEGVVGFSGDALIGISVWAKKEGYYSHGHYPAEADVIPETRLQPKLNRVITMRRIIAPRSLYVRTIPLSPAEPFRIPAEKTWLGFDFEHGDWVAPHGEGEVADILFRYEREFHGIFIPPFTNTTEERRRNNIRSRYERLGEEFTEEKFREEAGKWDGTLEIAFPNNENGILKVKEDYNVHSVLRMPHKAPKDGYKPNHGYEEKTYAPATHRKDVGFFLRTRVERDDNDEIISANYAKVYGDFRFSPVGYLSFTYYFNPEPNDRNLEFNGENLFPEGRTAMP
ncbi:MAG: hypothetical protein ACLFUF_04845 [Opitutales bacterium]